MRSPVSSSVTQCSRHSSRVCFTRSEGRQHGTFELVLEKLIGFSHRKKIWDNSWR